MPKRRPIRSGHLEPVIVRDEFNNVASNLSQRLIQTALGQVTGWSYINKFGRNPDIDTGSDPEDVWDQGGIYTFMNVASTMYISSDVAGDTSIEVTVQGLDGSYAEISEVISTNAADGRTFVALTQTFLRVYRAFVSGGDEPTGNIYISDDNTDVGGTGIPDNVANIKAQISIGQNQTLMAIYTIPANKTGLLLEWHAAVNLSGAAGVRQADLRLLTREFGGVFRVMDFTSASINGASINRPYPAPVVLLARTDIKLNIFEAGTDDIDISGGFTILLIDD